MFVGAVCRRLVPRLIRSSRCRVAAPVSAQVGRRRLSTIAGDKTTRSDTSTSDAQPSPAVTATGAGACQTKAGGALRTETSSDGKFVTLREADGDDVGPFHAIWLRHNCQCPACRQRFSGQKLIRPADLAASYSVQWAGVDPGDRLVYVDWHEEDHRSEFPVAFLRQSVHTPAERRRITSTPSGGVAWLPTIDFQACCSQRSLNKK